MLIFLPFGVDIAYDLGEIKTLINTPYTRGEMLVYISTSIGVIVALLAIFISILQNQPKIALTRERSTELDSNLKSTGKIIEQLSIRNKSAVEIQIKSVGFMSYDKHKVKKDNLKCMFNSIKYNLPRNLKGYSKEVFIFDEKPLSKMLKNWGNVLSENNLANKVVYYVELSNGIIIIKRNKNDDIYLKLEEK